MAKAVPKLLLIETGSTCAHLLSPDRFEVTQAETLAAGLEKISAHTYDLILIELTLPEDEGLSVFTQVHGAAQQTAIIVLTETEAEAEEMAAQTIWLGGQDYLLKSQLTEQTLSIAIRKALDRRHFQLMHNREAFLLQSLMNSVPDAVYFKDTRSRFLMISRSLAMKHHLADPQLAVGKTDADYFTAPHATQALADEHTIMRTGQPMEGIEESETWPDGSITWVSTTKLPLRNQVGRIVGTFGISRDITVRKNAQLALAEQSQVLQKKNQQIEDELKMARELQLAMLPQDFPAVAARPGAGEALKFYSYYLASGAVSGDFFDVYQLSQSVVGIFICDVMGHDVRAALVTAMMHALVEDLCFTAVEPGILLAGINQALYKVFRQSETTMFATAVYMVVDVATGQLSYANAAHPNPLRLKRPAGAVEVLEHDTGEKKSAALGLFMDSTYPTFHRPISEEDLLIFYTDGVIEEEAKNDEIFGQERLVKTISNSSALPPKEMLAKVLNEVRQFSGNQEFSDDICMLGVEVKQLKIAS